MKLFKTLWNTAKVCLGMNYPMCCWHSGPSSNDDYLGHSKSHDWLIDWLIDWLTKRYDKFIDTVTNLS